MTLQLLFKEKIIYGVHKNTAHTVCIVKFRSESPCQKIAQKAQNVLLYVLFLLFKDLCI